MGFIKSVKWIVPTFKKVVLGVDKRHYKDLPIVINNYNRLDTLLKLIHSLEIRGYTNIYIIDNNSTYPPVLQYYTERCPYCVYMLNRNVGHLAIWESGIYKQFRNSYFAYTDSDVEIHPDCPDDFADVFIKLLKKRLTYLKAGFSICIDDLPDHFQLKQQVCQWERQFWLREIEANVYKAGIDTTFAVYEPYTRGYVDVSKTRSLRVGFPYSIRHLPWYVDSQNLSDEEQYYVKSVQTSTHWSKQVE